MQIKGITAKALIFLDGALLLQLRDSDRDICYPGHWGLFGGEVQRGESVVDGLKRELYEELTLEKTEVSWQFRWVNPSTGTLLEFFSVQLNQNLDSLTLREGEGMALFEIDELDKLRATPDITENKLRIVECSKSLGRGLSISS